MPTREVFVDLVLANDLLVAKPSFDVIVEYTSRLIYLKAAVPELKLRPMNFERRGWLMWKLLHDYLGLSLELDQDTLAELRAGHISFLFNDDGGFIEDGRPI